MTPSRFAFGIPCARALLLTTAMWWADLITAGAQAAVFRCQDEHDHITYQSQACEQAGQAIQASDGRTATQVRQAQRMAERNATLATAMGRMRVKQERQALAHTATAASLTVPQPTRKTQQDTLLIPRRRDFRAVAPKDGSKKHRAASNQMEQSSIAFTR